MSLVLPKADGRELRGTRRHILSRYRPLRFPFALLGCKGRANPNKRTRNMALGSSSTTWPRISRSSSFAINPLALVRVSAALTA